MKLEISAKILIDPLAIESIGSNIDVRIRFVPKGSGHRGKARRLAEALNKSGRVTHVVQRSSGVDLKVPGTTEGLMGALEFLSTTPQMRSAS